jgi:uncharacterized protein (UPF0332 family)
MPVDINELIKHRIIRASETLDEARLAIENNRLHLAANRIYYSTFYIVSALALRKGFKTSKHSQLLSWFNKEFVKKDLIDKNLGKFYLDAFEMRQEGDYDDFINFELKYIEGKLEQAKDFVERVMQLINL